MSGRPCRPTGPDRPALGRSAAIAELNAGRGTRYDSDLVDAYIALFPDTVPPGP